MNVVETRALEKRFDQKTAVHSFDMHVGEGDIYGLVGLNGAGKSTVLKMICGLTLPTSGEIVLFNGAGESRQRIGALIEAPGLIPNLTAYQNLKMKALAMGVIDADEHCRNLLDIVGLSALGDERPRDFSRGMNHRLGVALAMVGSPDLLLLDEPLDGLDPESTCEMHNLLSRLANRYGMTVIISSHALGQLDRVATKYGIIKDGTMVREMTADQLDAECSDSLRVRTGNPERAIALFGEAQLKATIRAQPDGLLIVGDCDERKALKLLRDNDIEVLEFTVIRDDIEDYFADLLEIGESHV